ncbi:MAG: hypothetical protein M0R17_04070 [Candidatus Omnitrophica bacterium]|jgi:hypothetical protein|nr:hypothetical protein [Candidatus Omnitrophota bacterium]
MFENGITTEIEAYILGFLYADGFVTNKVENKYYMTGITLKYDDHELLEELTKYIPFKLHRGFAKIKDKSYEVIKAVYCNVKFTQQIIKLGIIPNKTYQNDSSILDNISDELRAHFIRGYFDGDGSIYLNDKKYGVSFVSINGKLLRKIKEILDNICSANPNLLIENGKYYRLAYRGNCNVEKIFKYLYKDATIKLSRKYDKFLKVHSKHYSNIRGITKYHNKYKVMFSHNGNKIYLGLFNDIDEAIKIRNQYFNENNLIRNEHAKTY